MEAKSKEVLKGTETEVACVITGITATATVSWRTSSGEVTGNDYVKEQGSHANGKQTSTLTVKGAKVTTDTAYTCRITSGSYADSAHSDTTVNLNVYGTLDHYNCCFFVEILAFMRLPSNTR